MCSSDLNSESAGLAINPTNPTNPTNSADSAAAAAATTAVTVTAFLLVPDLVDVLPSLTLLTGVALHSLNLGSSVYLLLAYISYFPGLSYKTILVFLTCLAVLRILYRPVKKQVRLRILI